MPHAGLLETLGTARFSETVRDQDVQNGEKTRSEGAPAASRQVRPKLARYVRGAVCAA